VKFRYLIWLLSIAAGSLVWGCSHSKVQRFQSVDGEVLLDVYDPIDCDQQKAFYVEVKKFQLAEDQYPKFNLQYANCGDSFDPSSVVFLEGRLWCGLFDSSLIANANIPLSKTMYGLVDRKRRRIFDYIDFDVLPTAIKTECLLQLEQCRRERLKESGTVPNTQ
jgi:hypothetical protein